MTDTALKTGNPHILWLDLETTGNEEHDEIIEVGAVVTDHGFVELSSHQCVFRTTRPISDIDPVVQEMHYRNGLWKDSYDATQTAMEAAADAGGILYWLGVNGYLKGGRIPLAGSGVGHFDRRYIKTYWPALDKRLTFWAIDIGVVRRFLRLSGYRIPDNVEKSHRALDDIREHIVEARTYRKMFATFEQARRDETDLARDHFAKLFTDVSPN